MKPEAPITAPPMGAELAEALRDLEPISTRRPRREVAGVVVVSLIVTAALVAGPAAWLWGASLRRDLPGLPVAWIVGAALVWAAGFGIPVIAALVPPRKSVMPSASRGATIAVTVASALLAWSFFAAVQAPGLSLVSTEANFAWVAAQCILASFVVALTPIALGLFTLRNVLPTNSKGVGAVLGAAGGALGGLALHFHCPWADALHVAVAHGGGVAIIVTCAAFVACRVAD